MDKHYQDIKGLIENNLVEIKNQEIRNNYHTLITHYNIGKELVEAISQSPSKYGLLKEYSKQLTEEYGKGYNLSNLRRMRDFYTTFPMCATVSHTLSWSHIVKLLPFKNASKRNYYINSCIEHGFSVRQLRDYIKSNAYERLVKYNIELKYADKEQEGSPSILNMIKDPILITMNNVYVRTN